MLFYKEHYTSSCPDEQDFLKIFSDPPGRLLQLYGDTNAIFLQPQADYNQSSGHATHHAPATALRKFPCICACN
jgi:hypothetical protein